MRKLVYIGMKTIGYGFAALLFVVFVEYQSVAYAFSALRHHMGAVVGDNIRPTPQQVLNAHVAPDATVLRFVAVADVLRCARTDFPGRILPATAEQLGVKGQLAIRRSDPSLTAALVAQWPEMPLIVAGDLVNERGTPNEFEQCFDPVWGHLRPRILPAPGNHEYMTPGAFGYFDYLGAQAGPGRRGYYALRWNNWLILSLNSEIPAGPGSPQAVWLARQLEAAPAACVMAFYHKPAHSLVGPRHGMQDGAALFAQLQQAGGSFVITGHNHIYERSHPLTDAGNVDQREGMIGLTVGTGGIHVAPKPDPLLPPQTAAAIIGTLGVLRVDLTADQFRWWFHRAPDAAVLDHGTAPCRPRGLKPDAALSPIAGLIP